LNVELNRLLAVAPRKRLKMSGVDFLMAEGQIKAALHR